MSSERPTKKVRQACDQCRRKKSRCPGEKPVCSYCARLRQQCTYFDEGLVSRQRAGGQSVPPPQTYDQSGVNTTHRLNELETKLSEVLVALHESRQHATSIQQSPDLPQPSLSSPVRPTSIPKPDFPQEIIQQVADLYLRYCHCQPLPLFAPDHFSRKLPSRDEEVVLAISAIALRFSTGATFQYDCGEIIRVYLEKARSLTMQRISNGIIELSTLQSLCLLSWLDFYNGDTHRASLYTSLASDLCKSSNLASNVTSDATQEEKLRCFWSIVLLQRLHPNITGPFHISFEEDSMPPYPGSSPRPILRTSRAASDSRLAEHKDLGIVAYAVQLTEVWYKVARYAHRRASAGPYPPWSPKSDYAKIIAHQMNGETAMPYSKHRFKPAKFEERSPEELYQHRDYWSPWLFTQILYHTIICVLNHPLLLSLRLHCFRVASIPEIWLQHTDDLITQHSQWIIHIIDLVESKSFFISDPFIAHCIAIVATIHLQQSFRDDGDVQQVKKANFAKCLQFCQKIGEKWPYVQQMAGKLQDFERVVSDSYLNSAASQTNDRIFIDLSLFWEILESAAISERPDNGGLIFGQSLRSNPRPSIAAEELSARLLPEPSRVAAAGSPATGSVSQQTPDATSSGDSAANGPPYLVNDDFNVLAQSYFAQGQDFVGNMDDWWLMEDAAQQV